MCVPFLILIINSIESFILHRKQCCFYSNTSRIDPSSSPSIYQNTPPNVALMSAIYLMGAFFARISGWESQLLEQTLQEVSRSLHNAEPSADMVQALCLLAQYFFFTGRDMEGSRHLSAAKRIATDIGLHQVSPVATFPFGPEYTLDTASYNWHERASIFWQMFIVNNCWSLNNDCCVASSTLSTPCRHISTPLPVEDTATFVRRLTIFLWICLIRSSFCCFRRPSLLIVRYTFSTKLRASTERIYQSRPSRHLPLLCLIARCAFIVRS